MKEQNKVMSAEEKDTVIKGFLEKSAKAFIGLMNYFDLKTHIDCEIKDHKSGKSFVFMFREKDFHIQNTNYILSQRIDELAERIADNAKLNDDCNNWNCQGMSINKYSILKIANDFKTELNLQTDQNQPGNQ